MSPPTDAECAESMAAMDRQDERDEERAARASERRAERAQELLEQQAAAYRAMTRRLDDLLLRMREDHYRPNYADLLAVKGLA